jgi:hypothetical protein
MRNLVFTILAVVAFAGSAAAQPYSPPSRGSAVGVRGYLAVDAARMTASDSFKAIFGSAAVTSIGGGAEVDAWQHVFVRVAVTRATRTGSRVFVDNGQVFPLNIPLSITMTPIEVGGGWRFPSRGRVTPYAGGGIVSLGYQEVSDFAQTGENGNSRYTGGSAFGGVDVGIWKGLFVGAEAQYRHIPTPDTSATVMHEFLERDLGGAAVRVLIGFSTK